MERLLQIVTMALIAIAGGFSIAIAIGLFRRAWLRRDGWPQDRRRKGPNDV